MSAVIHQPLKYQVSVLTVLVFLAIAGIVTFQGIWLFNSYHISKQQTGANIQKAFDEGLSEYQSLKTDTVREMLKKAINWDEGYNYHFFNYPHGMQVGFRNGNQAYILYPVNVADTASIAKHPLAFLCSKINALSLDELRPLYSSLVGGRDYPPKSVLDSLQLQLMLRYENLYADTAIVNRAMKNAFAHNGMRFDGSVRYFADVKDVYQQSKPQAALAKLPPMAERAVAVTPNNKPLSVKLQELNGYVKKLNSAGDSSYTARLLFDDTNGLLLGKAAVLLLAVKTPSAYLIKTMLFSIAGSLVLMLFLGFCIIYMLYLIVRQKKLSDIKNDFISNISHELKTPIATALAAVQGMRYFDIPKDINKTEQYLGVATAELQRLSGLVTKILSSSVFESAQFEISPLKFDLYEMINEIIAAVRLVQPDGAGIALSYTAAREVLADKTYLYQVINNLVDNAVKYSGYAPDILITCRDVAAGIEIKVQDNGPGIPAEYQKHIFDKFFRVPQAHGHRVKGHGLGLNYIKAIMEKHSGTIELTQSNAQGSTFTIYLPQ